MKYDWTQSGLSSHEAVKLTPLVEELAQACPKGFLLPLDEDGDLVRIAPEKSVWVVRDTISFFPNPGPFTETRCIILGYQYRDASNYKQYREVRFRGSLNPVDIAILATALNAGDDDTFIPSQIGLEDLQPEWTDDDHVWHTVEEISLAESTEGDRDIAELLKAARKICAAGSYDMMAAMESRGF
jgi:hypothetical protein